jgi:hypothetical protein
VSLPLKRRHWIAVKKVNDQFFNLDSKLDAPHCIGNVIFRVNLVKQLLISVFFCLGRRTDSLPTNTIAEQRQRTVYCGRQ